MGYFFECVGEFVICLWTILIVTPFFSHRTEFEPEFDYTAVAIPFAYNRSQHSESNGYR